MGQTPLIMASIWKHPESKFWFACYTDAKKRQRKKSTKLLHSVTGNRDKALRMAKAWEDAHVRQQTMTQIQSMAGILAKEICEQELPSSTVRAFLDTYLQRRKKEVRPATLAAYKGAATRFKTWLNDRADMELSRVEKRDITAFRNHLAESLNPNTTNNCLKILRVFFTDAQRDSLILQNPCLGVSVLKKDKDGVTRRGFTLEELRVVMRETQDTEWASLIRFGLYTGQRLGDLASLRWSAIDLISDEIRITTGKTGTRVKIPICEPLKASILTLPAGDAPNAFVHPWAAEIGVSHLSRVFGEVLARCGFRAVASHAKDKAKNGRSARRVTNELSFHSLRHSAVSMMKNAGVSPAVVQDLIGHESAEMSAHYTHIEGPAKLKALEALPVI